MATAGTAFMTPSPAATAHAWGRSPAVAPGSTQNQGAAAASTNVGWGTVAVGAAALAVVAHQKSFTASAVSFDQTWRSRGRASIVQLTASGTQQLVSFVKSPKQGYEAFVERGAGKVQEPLWKFFLSSIYAGCYCGFGGLLALSLAGNIHGITALNPGFRTFLYAFLFPVNLLLIQVTNAALFTGTTAIGAAALIEGKLGKDGLQKYLSRCATAWLGNVIGGIGFALFVTACGLNIGNTADMAAELTLAKTSSEFVPTVMKGIGCNWLVGVCFLLVAMTEDLGGKYLAILLTMSTHVACGFEHLPANAFGLPFALLSGMSSVTWKEVFLRNLLPASLGNLIGGFIVVACSYSAIFGRLGGLGEKKG